MLHNCRTLLNRLMNCAGGFLGYSGDYSTGAAQVMMTHIVGSMEVYEQQTTWPSVLEDTQFVVIWGADPIVTLCNSWNVPDHVGCEGFHKLKDKGIKTIVIDPIRNETAKFLNSDWIAPKAYTDCTMMLGIAHTLISENLHDKDFLKKYTVGYDEFENYVLGKKDGIVKTAECAEDICGVKADIIRNLARSLVNQRTMIMAGWGMQRQHHGEQPLRMLVTLACMLGQIGLPGGGFGFSYHYASGGSPTAKGGIVAGINAGQAPENNPVPIPVARLADCFANPGKTIDFNGNKVTYPDVKMWYIAGGNPLHHHQDTNGFVQKVRRLETIIVNDPYWTASAKFADIVLLPLHMGEMTLKWVVIIRNFMFFQCINVCHHNTKHVTTLIFSKILQCS